MNCTVDGCDRTDRIKRGMCGKHYQRWARHGDPALGADRFDSPEDAFAARTRRDTTTGCLIWTGAHNDRGYGQIHINGRMIYAHRYAWEREHGPIPSGLVIDHLCWNHTCVEVSHLRAVTSAENLQNRAGASRVSQTGIRNVYRLARGVYLVQVKRDGQCHFGGEFTSLEEATRVAEDLRHTVLGELPRVPA